MKTKMLITVLLSVIILGSCSPAAMPIPTIMFDSTSTSLPVPTSTVVPTPIGGGSGRIAFSSTKYEIEPNVIRGETSNCMINADGSNLIQLTSDQAIDRDLTLSPDGKKIVFISRQDGNSEIYVKNADGSNPIKITNNQVPIGGQPSWSPDGQKIAFIAYPGNMWAEIYVMNADGSNQTNLTNNKVHDSNPTWSPDGQKIMFLSNLGGYEQIYVMNADGSDQKRLTKNNKASYDIPIWSPDGHKIKYMSIVGISQIYEMNADGSNQARVTNNQMDIGNPIWSPDGQKIAFSSIPKDGIRSDGRILTEQIWVMNADGSNPTQLTKNESYDASLTWLSCDMSPKWSPDGQKIAFSSGLACWAPNHEIYVMNTDGSNLTRLTNNKADDDSPVWLP
jgi:Tol biopolymer transport system component